MNNAERVKQGRLQRQALLDGVLLRAECEVCAERAPEALTVFVQDGKSVAKQINANVSWAAFRETLRTSPILCHTCIAKFEASS